jgi:hypothetical protein
MNFSFVGGGLGGFIERPAMGELMPCLSAGRDADAVRWSEGEVLI